VILSSWFLALVMFGLVFLAGTAIGAAFSSSKAPATTLANAEKPHLHPEHARGQAPRVQAQAPDQAAEARGLVRARGRRARVEDRLRRETSKLAGHTTSKKSSSAKPEAAVGVAPPKRLTGADARAVFDKEVNPARNAKNLIGDREKEAKKSMFADIKQSLSRDSNRVAAALGHSYTPVTHKAKTMQHDPEAPTTMEIAAHDYVVAFEQFSAMELLSKAHDLLVSVDKYEQLAAKIDQDDLADSLLELDSTKPTSPSRMSSRRRSSPRRTRRTPGRASAAPRASSSAATR
jgi:hypothetical protein